ncbi:hypothetical protein CRM22_006593 [Opisthorchis felineus]|uniref:Activating transcription factor 7-interacting protein Fn3 domain-containing protein n=1 Tax=Opisthorchis felineus TaxID=147828 RepID=A0A4S2LK39_OPIFE|nr:hypothetical protein CRM22_006593 [Opisthorchis felineus]
MAGDEHNCEDDVSPTKVNGPTKVPTSDAQEVPHTTDCTNNTSEPNVKRARLGFDNTNQPHVTTNGFINKTSDKASNVGWPFRPDLMQLFRSSFDCRFKDSLQHNLSSYVTRLNTAEESLTALKTEFSEITERMDCIEKASKDLKQIIIERVTLPKPTAGVGQRRTLSSQAPRLPPSAPATSAAEKIANSNTAIQQPAVVCRNNVLNPAVVTSPSVLTSFQSPVHTGPVPNTVAPNIRPPLPLITTRPATPVHQNPFVRTPLNVRPMDTIDLTSEGSPTVEDTTPQPKKTNDSIPALPHTVGTNPAPHVAFTNSPLSPHPFANHNPITPTPIAPPNNPRVAWPNAPHMAPNVGKNPRFSSFSPRQMSFRELQRLPVAPLPPIPLQTVLPTPVQPMPQLTIAEAAEGICLQWNVAHRSMVFELATAYEIYSYASSEVTLETLCTCLPWKKVGDVAALPLPMACTLTHVQPNNLYYFIVRSVDRFRRYSAWSNVVNAYVG